MNGIDSIVKEQLVPVLATAIYYLEGTDASLFEIFLKKFESETGGFFAVTVSNSLKRNNGDNAIHRFLSISGARPSFDLARHIIAAREISPL